MLNHGFHQSKGVFKLIAEVIHRVKSQKLSLIQMLIEITLDDLRNEIRHSEPSFAEVDRDTVLLGSHRVPYTGWVVKNISLI